MGTPGDHRYTSGDPCVHKDGRKGVILKPGGVGCIIVKFGDKLVAVSPKDLKEPKYVKPT